MKEFIARDGPLNTNSTLNKLNVFSGPLTFIYRRKLKNSLYFLKFSEHEVLLFGPHWNLLKARFTFVKTLSQLFPGFQKGSLGSQWWWCFSCHICCSPSYSIQFATRPDVEFTAIRAKIPNKQLDVTCSYIPPMQISLFMRNLLPSFMTWPKSLNQRVWS